ncbi:hypothetical protein JYK21_03815 [Ralstonia pickettii]|nr:hypothetical protein [Ralstonia pickettii]
MPKILAENKLMMKVHAGEAETETEKIHLAYSVQGTPVITFEDGTTVYWEWQELLEQAVELKKKEVCKK